MAGSINKESGFEYGEFLNRYFHNRVKKNKNVILIFTGSTGSGKTYSCLSQAELWYKYHFKEEYSGEHTAFSLGALIKKINDLNKEGKLRAGELFILEEAGANFGNLDFQNKLAKLFGYILQSFRSKNLILLLTVPVLTMVNKQARQLTHGHFTTKGIDFQNNLCKVKPLFHQLSQSSGKSYWKYPRVKVAGMARKIQILEFPLPSEKVIEEYEKAKDEFVTGLTDNFVQEWEFVEQKQKKKLNGDFFTDLEKERMPKIENMRDQGLNHYQMADHFGITYKCLMDQIRNMKKKGWVYDKSKKTPKSLVINT